MEVWPGYLERLHQLPQADDLEILVDQHQVKCEQHADSMDRVCRNDPHAAVRLKRSLAQQANQPAHHGVRDADPKSEKGLLRLVVDKHVAVFARHKCLSSGGVEGKVAYFGAVFFIL